MVSNEWDVLCGKLIMPPRLGSLILYLCQGYNRKSKQIFFSSKFLHNYMYGSNFVQIWHRYVPQVGLLCSLTSPWLWLCQEYDMKCQQVFCSVNFSVTTGWILFKFQFWHRYSPGWEVVHHNGCIFMRVLTENVNREFCHQGQIRIAGWLHGGGIQFTP